MKKRMSAAAVVLAVSGIVLAAGTAAADDTGSIAGRVWLDRDADGQQDAGEGGRRLTVTVTKDGQPAGSATTDADGRFLVTGLAAGGYQVAAVATGFAPTTAGTVDVTLADGAEGAANFGVRGGSLSGVVWRDADSDGVRQQGEPTAPAGTVVQLAGGAETTVDGQGRYRFDDLPSGDYQVSSANAAGKRTAGGVRLAAGADATADLGLLGPNDVSLDKLTFTPDKAAYQVGDTITVTMTVASRYLADNWSINGTFPKELSVAEVAGMVAVETGAGTIAGHSDGLLDPAETAVVTVTFRADKETTGTVNFQVTGGKWADINDTNNRVSRGIRVTAKATPTKPVTNDLAHTGASPLASLAIGGALVLLGAGLLIAVRRRRSTQK